MNIFYFVIFFGGFVVYLIADYTPKVSHIALIKLFCRSGGVFNDRFAQFINFFKPKTISETNSGILFSNSNQEMNKVLENLRREGVVIFNSILSEETIVKLIQFTNSTKATIRRMDMDDGLINRGQEIFDINKLKGVRYDYNANDLLQNEEIQNLIADHSLLWIAQEYLGTEPRLDVLSMWWHTNYSDQPDSISAQKYHFDMDRIKWLKVFIYLTDVNEDNGPHCYIRGSHVHNGIPQTFLNRGYVRLEDAEIKSYYCEKDILSLTAPKGTIIIEDTRGLHKGAHVTGDPRLILQIQYSNSLYGAKSDRASLDRIKSKKLESAIKNWPRVYRQYK